MYTILPKRLTLWISRIGLLALVLSLGVLGSPAKPAAAQGITATVNAVGTGLEFHASSPFAVTWDIWLSTASIEMSPSPPHFPTGGTLPPRVKHVASTIAQASFAPAFYELSPGRTYNYIVRGGSSYLTGSVKTLNYQVTVNFKRIDVIDDSDALSAGDLNFYLVVKGHTILRYGEVSGSSGESLYPNRSASLGAPYSVSLAVKGIDDDCDFLDICTTEPEIEGQEPDYTSGSSDIADWASAQSGPISIARLGSLNANYVAKTVTFQTTAYRLKYKVYALIEVRYF
jgi:hypothetical protein